MNYSISKSLVLVLTLACVTCAQAYTKKYNVITSSKLKYDTAFYIPAAGYETSAFNGALDQVRADHKLLVIVTGTSGCNVCDSFAQDSDNRSSDVQMTLKSAYGIHGYFRGSATTYKAANDFVKSLSGMSNSGTKEHISGLISVNHSASSTHVLAMYAEFEDGCKFIRSVDLPGNWEDFKDRYNSWVSTFRSKRDSHKITAGARFANANTTLAQLQATESTTAVHVPFVRKTFADKEEVDSFVVTYPDGTVTTNRMPWAAGEANKVCVVDVKGKWTLNGTIELTLCDSIGNVVDSSAIHCVVGGNAFSSPDLEFDGEGAWGRWTLYSDENWNSATQKVYAANTYSQPDTNDNAVVELVVLDIPIAPSNRYEVVYTNNLEFFEGLPSTVSNWFEIVAQPYECFGTNRTFYVEMPGCATNEDVSARALVREIGDWATTNFYCVALTNSEHATASAEVTWTNLEAVIAVDCTNFYYTVVTNEYQYGEAGREAGGRDELAIQSFVLKVTGSAVWNTQTVAFAASVLGSKECADWCESNKVVTLLQECADPDTGASLFSHTVAANGRSGSAFLSRNGLDASQCEQPPASNVFEVALYRPDGILAGILAPQMDRGVCDKDENIARLRELVFTANDLTEPENNDEASTKLEARCGAPADEAAFQTLSVSDKKDVFNLSNIIAGGFVSVTVSEHLDADEKPLLSVWRRGADGKAAGQIAALGKDENGNSVWRFSESDIVAGLFAEVTAWTAGNSETHLISSGGSGSGSILPYDLVVQEAEEFKGAVSFACPSNQLFDVDSETEIELKVERTGYTGQATATVTLTECQLPEESYSWVNANNSTNIVWEEGEYGEKSFFVKVKNVLWEDSVSNLVFTITAASGAARDDEKSSAIIGIQQEDDENALTGKITVSGREAADQTLWLESGVSNKITVVRERVKNETTGKQEARGKAFAEIAVTGGAQLTTNRLEWLSGARVGEREFWVTMPVVGRSGEQAVTVTIVGKDADGKRISEPAAIRLKYMVVPNGAPRFLNGIDAEAYQYVPFDESKGLAILNYDDEKLTIKGCELLSGSLPDGLAASVDKFGLRVSGTPTGTNSTEATCQITLESKDGTYNVKTMPVSVKISSKALGGTQESGGADNAVVPAFADRRVWQYLPMTNGTGRLVGLLNLSAATKGSLSARYNSSKRTVQFLAPALGGVVTNEVAGGYRAYAKMDKAGYDLDVSFTTDGSVFATLSEPAADGEEEITTGFASKANATTWAFVKDGAKAWQGCYTVVFDQTGDAADDNAGGVAAISLRMNSSAMARTGRATYNGILPNGRPLNGTTAFLPPVAGAEAVKVPILWSSAADSLSAMLVVTNNGSSISVAADPAVTSFWTTGGGERTGDLAPTGGIFASEDVKTAWRRDFGVEELAFKYGGKTGSATVVPDGNGIKVGSAGSAAEDGFELESISLNRKSGMVAGTIAVKIGPQRVSLPFRGAVLPGDKECFARGTAWYVAIEDGSSVRKSVVVEIAK